MTTSKPLFRLSWAALATTALLAACGGGGASAPPGSEDTTPPTVAITDNVSATNATGAITFTFTFSEAVSGFAFSDVVVTGGTATADNFTMASDNLSATLVVTPTANSTGTVQVSVAAEAFGDFADNVNTEGASAEQAFDTTTPPSIPSGDTGTCTAAPCINFSESTVGLFGFEGLEDGVDLVTDPADANNRVAKLTKEAGDQTWAGATVHLGGTGNTVARIDPAQGISLRVYSPAVGKTIMVKIEGSGAAQEVQATSTKAGEWETLTFSFPNAPSNAVYNKVSVFPGFGTALDEVYYIDELKYVTTTEAVLPSTLPLTFDDSNLTYIFTGFGGADDSGLADDPADSNNKVGRATKADNAQTWAGTTFMSGIVIPVTNTQTSMTLRVYSPVANIPVRLKVENAADNTQTVETEATVTQANTWQTLTFNFANQAAGTAALDVSKTYDKASVFFNFGTDGASGGGGTFYFDDLKMAD